MEFKIMVPYLVIDYLFVHLVQPGHVAVSEDILVVNEDLRTWEFGRRNVRQSVAEVNDGVAKLNSTNKQTHMQNQPLIPHWSPIIIRGISTNFSTATPSARIRLVMEDHTLIDEEVHRRKCNNTRLRKQEEDRQLIAEGEGQISLSSHQQDAKFSPVGPRKAKTMALKNASEFMGLRTL